MAKCGANGANPAPKTGLARPPIRSSLCPILEGSEGNPLENGLIRSKKFVERSMQGSQLEKTTNQNRGWENKWLSDWAHGGTAVLTFPDFRQSSRFVLVWGRIFGTVRLPGKSRENFLTPLKSSKLPSNSAA